MSLRLELRLTGDARGAKQALADTKAAIEDLGKKTTETGKAAETAVRKFEWNDAPQIGKVADDIEKTGKSLKTVATEAPAAGAGIEDAGKRAQGASFGFGNLRGALTGIVAGFAGGVIGAGLSAVFEAATGAAFSFAQRIFDDTPRIKENLKEHQELVRRIKGAYNEADDAASSYGNNSRALLLFEAQQNVARLQRDLAGQLPDFDSFGGGGLNAEVLRAYGGGGPFAQAIAELRRAVADGSADIIAFRNEIAALAAAEPADSKFRTLAAAILESTEAAAHSQEELARARDLLRGVEGDADAAARALGGSADKYDSLGDAATDAAPGIDEATRALAAAQLQAANANPQLEKSVGWFERLKALGAGISGSISDFFGGVTGSAGGDRFGSLGGGGEARPDGGSALLMGFVADDTLLRSAAGDPFAALLAGRREAIGLSREHALAIREESREAQAFGEAAAGVVSQLLRGADAVDVLIGVAGRFADQLLSAAFSGFAGSFGGGGAGGGLLGGIASLFGSLFGGFRAEGGDVAGGKAYWVGEKGKPELFVPGVSGRVLPISAAPAGPVGGSGFSGNAQMSVTNHITINNPIGIEGVHQAVERGVRAGLEGYDAALPDRLAAIDADPRVR